MDFFARQDEAKAKSRAFYISFFIAVIIAVVILYFVITVVIGTVCFVLGYTVPGYPPLPLSLYGHPPKVLSLRPFLSITPFIVAVICLVSLWKVFAIRRGGGHYIARKLGGVELIRPQNHEEKQLLHVVEEMAVASGLPRPAIYILAHEVSINAVTAGLDYEDAFIAVTQGALDNLDRDELQAVVAHEYAHIFSGDYALNLTMAGWLHGLLFFSARGKDLLSLAGHIGGRGSLYPFVIGVILWAGGWAGKFSAELVEAAFSRQREYLADAFSAQFTRNPKALAGALMKIAGMKWAGALGTGQSLSMKSFFIVSPSKINGLLRTHPPIEKRIKVLNPDWDGEIPTIKPKVALAKKATDELDVAAARPGAGPFNFNREEMLSPQNWAAALAILSAAGEGAAAPVAAAAALGAKTSGGQPSAAATEVRGRLMAGSLEATGKLLSLIPEKLRAAAADPQQVAALTLSLFIHNDDILKTKQAGIIRHFLGDEACALVGDFHAALTDQFRLPLLNLSAPALRHLAPETKRGLSRAADELIKADGQIDFFEAAASCVLDKYLERAARAKPRMGNAPPQINGDSTIAAGSGLDSSVTKNTYADMDAIKADIAALLDFVAVYGAADRAGADKAFQVGASVFSGWLLTPGAAFQKHPPENLCPILNRFSQTEKGLKLKLVSAAVAVASFDGVITGPEYEIVRSLAAALEVPLPILVYNRAG